MNQQTEPALRLVSLLDAYRHDIISAWIDMIRALPDCHYCQQPASEVRAWLTDDWAVIAKALKTGRLDELENHLAELSLARLSLGFDIGEVTQALLLCKEAALPFIRRAARDAGMDADAALLQLDVCLRYAVGCFARRYAVGMNRNLREQQQRLEQLAVVEERQRLARELHDSVNQSLYSVTLYADAAAMALAANQPDVTTGYLKELRASAQEAMREMRLLIFELHPPELEQEGLVAALQARLAAVEARTGVQTEFRVSDERPLPLAVERELYRIAQEVLNNVARHANARRVSVHLCFSAAAVSLEVRDDGVGFDPNAARRSGGMGLRNIEERVAKAGGTLTLTSQPGRGTQVHVELALKINGDRLP